MLLARMADLDRETPLSAPGNPTTYPDEFVKTHYRGTDIYGVRGWGKTHKNFLISIIVVPAFMALQGGVLDNPLRLYTF